MLEKEEYSKNTETDNGDFDLGSDVDGEIIDDIDASKNRHRDFGLAVGKILTAESGDDILGSRQGRLERIDEHQKEELIAIEQKKLRDAHKKIGRTMPEPNDPLEDSLRKIATSGTLSVLTAITHTMKENHEQKVEKEAKRKAARKEYVSKKTASSFQPIIGKSNKIGESGVADKMSKAAMALMNTDEFTGNEDFAI